MMSVEGCFNNIVFALRLTAEKYDNPELRNAFSEIEGMVRDTERTLSRVYGFESGDAYQEYADIINNILQPLLYEDRKQIYSEAYSEIGRKYNINIYQIQRERFPECRSAQKAIFKLGMIDDLINILSEKIKTYNQHIKEA